MRYAITPAGSAEVADWIASPVQRQQSRDELAMKLAVASTLPGVDLPALIQTQRSATLQTLQELTRTKANQAAPASASDLAWSLVVESMIFAAEAEVRWLDHSEATIARAIRSGVVAPVPVEAPARRRAAVDGGTR